MIVRDAIRVWQHRAVKMHRQRDNAPQQKAIEPPRRQDAKENRSRNLIWISWRLGCVSEIGFVL
jgi:hypothetical protein